MSTVNTYSGAIHYDIHLNMKIACTISRIFQDMSLSELELMRLVCQLENNTKSHFLCRTSVLIKSLKICWLRMKPPLLLHTLYKISPQYVFADKRCYQWLPIFWWILTSVQDKLSGCTYFWDTAVPWGSNIATIQNNQTQKNVINISSHWCFFKRNCHQKKYAQ